MQNMKLPLLACAALLLLSGCAPTPPPATAAAINNPFTPAAYLKLMHKLSDFANFPDGDLIKIAANTCEVMQDKNGWLLSLKSYTENGYDAGQSGAAIRYEVSAYCPQLAVNIP